MNELNKALKVAVEAHKNQLNKFDREPYILHVLRVVTNTKAVCDALKVKDAETYLVVAALHDVVEDTDLSLLHLMSLAFSPAVVAAVDAVTHKKDEPYDEYIERCAANGYAAVVKTADLTDHLNLTEKFAGQHAKYQKAQNRLLYGDGGLKKADGVY